MNNGNRKRAVSIKREHKMSCSARKFRIIVNGIEAGYIEDGGVLRLKLPYEDTDISFSIGKKVMAHVYLDDLDGEEVNILCYAKGSGGIIAGKSMVDFFVTEHQKKEKIPLVIRILITIPLVIIMFYLCLNSFNSFFN